MPGKITGIFSSSSKTVSYLSILVLLVVLPITLLLRHSQMPHQGHVAGNALTGLHIQGNQFVDDNGKPVVLRGVNYAGLAWPCSHDEGLSLAPLTPAAIAALVNWHINVARIGIPEDCWLGINGLSPNWSGPTYQQAVINFVNLLNQNGIYVEVSLFYVAPGTVVSIHQLQMPDADHSLAAWTSMADAFKNDHSIIFGAYGEPHNINVGKWLCWRDGGTCAGIPYQTAGMQQIVNTIRATGATQPITLSGLNWANDVSEWLQYEPTDPLNQLGAEVDVYPQGRCASTSCWDSQFGPVLQQVPLIAGEAGNGPTGVCSASFISSFWNWADSHNVSYEVWMWALSPRGPNNPCDTGALILDYNGIPSPIYGEAYKAHLAALAGISPTPTSTSTRAYNLRFIQST